MQAEDGQEAEGPSVQPILWGRLQAWASKVAELCPREQLQEHGLLDICEEVSACCQASRERACVVLCCVVLCCVVLCCVVLCCVVCACKQQLQCTRCWTPAKAAAPSMPATAAAV